MRWPLSLDFYKLISRTADVIQAKGAVDKVTVEAQCTLPQPGLLTPDRKYYWRARAMNSQGVWGAWSKTWSFIPRGPGYPVNVTLDYNPAGNSGTLRWAANPAERRPAKYRIYGSDEKGFTIADKPFQSTVGVTTTELAAWNPWFPANFIAETASSELAVIGAGVDLPAANKSYYRVVAVDEQGKLSGPSDYAAGPRPVIFSQPVLVATVGNEYRYQAKANRSLGDLSARVKDGQQVNGYFDIEKPAFKLEQGPSWLKLDEATGLLSGIPDAAGKAEIVISARIERDARELDDKTLAWGNEKVLSTRTDRVGTATQRFVIAVQ